MVALLAGALILAIFLGSVMVSPKTVCQILANHFSRREIYPAVWSASEESIVWTIRFPRVIMAFIVGAGLALSGILMQALTRNSLADPYVLGISSGASAGAVAVIMYGWFSFMGTFHIAFGAGLGALISIVIAMKVSSVDNKITATQLVLAGIAVSTLFTALTNFMIYYKQSGSDKQKTAMYWMMGSLSGANWSSVLYVFIIFLVCVIAILFFTGHLDILMLGDDAATTLGLNLRFIKIGIIILCTLRRHRQRQRRHRIRRSDHPPCDQIHHRTQAWPADPGSHPGGRTLYDPLRPDLQSHRLPGRASHRCTYRPLRRTLLPVPYPEEQI